MSCFAYYIGGPLDLTKKHFAEKFPPFEERVVHNSFNPLTLSDVPLELSKLKVHRYKRTHYNSNDMGDVFFYMYAGTE